MLDSETLRIAREQISLDGEEQRARLSTEFRAAAHLLAAKGMLSSGFGASQLTSIAVDSIRARAEAAWRILHRCATTAGIRYSGALAPTLKSEVARALPENLSGITDDLIAHFNRSDPGGVRDAQLTIVREARVTALRKVGSEIDLFVHALSRQTESSNNESNNAVFHIYSPVASIQTGRNSVATVSQEITSETRVTLIDALNAVATALTKHPAALASATSDVRELVADSKHELEKPTPNLRKVGGFLSAIGSAIQTTASLQPAYAALKSAAATIGITLP